MNKSLILLINLLLYSIYASAYTGSYVLCTTSDGQDNQWSAVSTFERAAINKAYDDCKKQSSIPDTCSSSLSACETYVNGVSTRPLWQCTALDHTGHRWKNEPSAHRDDAALGAKAFCQQRNGSPDSCYVNLLTCVNLNGELP